MNPSNQIVPYTGGTATIQVTTQSGCAWTASGGATWAPLANASGSGSGTISLTAVANSSGGTQSAIVTLAGFTAVITQPATACSYGLSQTQINAPAAGSSGTITVTTSCPVIASSNQSWVTTTPLGTSVAYTVAPNNGPSRSATLTIGTQTVSVVQAAISGAPIPPMLVSPVNGAAGVSLAPTLTWNASTGATSYGVYFGTSPTPPLVNNVTTTTYSPGTLVAGVTYYWKIVAINSGGTGASSIWSFTTSTAATLMPTSVSPGAGSALTQTFTFTFTDPNGYSDLMVLDVLINNYLDGVGACYFAWVPAGASAGYVYLVDDAGDGSYASGSPMYVPTSNSVQNSQCTINGTGSSVSSSGNTLTLTLAITFKPAFAGNRIFYMAARNNTQNSGWQALGTWNVPDFSPTGPAVSGMTPGRSTTMGQTYTFTFTDSNGYPDLNVLDILTNSFLDGIGACYVAYVPTGPTTGYVYLVDDAGDSGYAAGSPMLLSSGGTLQNSQCTINAVGSSASASGNTLNLNLNITFKAGFAGNQIFYLAARNASKLSQS